MAEHTVSVSELRHRLSYYVNLAANAGKVIIITNRGKPHAVLIGIEDYRRLERLETQEANDGTAD